MSCLLCFFFVYICTSSFIIYLMEIDKCVVERLNDSREFLAWMPLVLSILGLAYHLQVVVSLSVLDGRKLL